MFKLFFKSSHKITASKDVAYECEDLFIEKAI